MESEADSVVRHSALRIVVGADAFAADSCAYLAFAGCKPFILRFRRVFQEDGREALYGLSLFCAGIFYILTGYDDAYGDVGDADCGLGCVYRLSSAAGA